MIPARTFLFALDAAFLGWVALQQIQGEAAQHRHGRIEHAFHRATSAGRKWQRQRKGAWSESMVCDSHKRQPNVGGGQLTDSVEVLARLLGLVIASVIP